MYGNDWVSQKVCFNFSIKSYRKIQMKFLANPIIEYNVSIFQGRLQIKISIIGQVEFWLMIKHLRMFLLVILSDVSIGQHMFLALN